jgi:hypothetical protein
MAADSAPKPYLDASARLQCQKPIQVSDEEWGKGLPSGRGAAFAALKTGRPVKTLLD